MRRAAILVTALFPLLSIPAALAAPAPTPPKPAAAVTATAEQLALGNKLQALFPQAPAGWSASKPTSGVISTDQGNHLSSTRQYVNEAPDAVQSVDISITDWGTGDPYIKKSLESFKTDVSSDDDGFTKPMTIQGFPGQEQVDLITKLHKLWVIVNERYYVEFAFSGVPVEEIDGWAKRLDLKKLAEIR